MPRGLNKEHLYRLAPCKSVFLIFLLVCGRIDRVEFDKVAMIVRRELVTTLGLKRSGLVYISYLYMYHINNVF